MKRLHRSAPALLFVFLLLASLVVSPGLAKATSNYDSSLQLASSLRTSSAMIPNQACDPIDLSLDWSTYLTDESKWRPGANYSTAKASFLSAKANVANGAWGVHQYSGTPAHGGARDIVEFWWTEDPTAHLVWSTDGVSLATLTPGANIWIASIACTNYYYGGGSSVPVVTLAAAVPSYGVSTATSSAGYTAKLFFAHGFELNYPVGYEGDQIPTDQPTAKYVAMGDSFSSGEGNPGSFDPATNLDGVNECHRSYKAYPRLLQGDADLNLGPVAFVACGGATTSSIMSGQWNEPAQIAALSDATEVATITIGGNNIGFKDFATACTLDICNFSTPIYSSVVDKINNTLPGELNAALEAIASKVSTAAKVHVVGYPYITPAVMPSGLGSGTCWPFNGQADNPDPALNDGATVHDVVTRLNSALSHAVNEANDPRFSFVDPNGTDSPFVDHDWCKQDRYFQIVALDNLEYSFHPNQDGHNAYKTIMKQAIG